MQDHSDHARSAVEAFLPHGFCYLWNPQLLWTHVVADLLIGFAYVAISTTLVYLVWKGRREFPFQGMFVAFGLFIVACGATHFVEVYTLWNPVYWFSAGVKVVTAVASVGTAVLLPPLVPRVLHTVREAKLSEERRVQVETAERFRTMAEAMPQIVWTAAADGSVDYYNRRWWELTGIPVERGHGWSWQIAVHPEDEELTVSAWRRSIATGEPYEVTHRVRDRDGNYRWLLSRAVAVRDPDGNIARWFGSGTDVDAQKRAEQEMREAKEEAERANRSKSEFLSTMSHELRTPLNAIGGYVDLMELGIQGAVSEAQAKSLERVKTNQRHLLSLINDILHYAKIEAGGLEFEITDVAVGEILAELEPLIAPQVLSAGLEYTCTPGDPALAARGDREKIRQILLNLLTNAVKFTPAGGRIAVSCEADGPWVRIHVSDTGHGIPVEMFQKIFDPFVQVRDAGSRDSSRQGVGLGLAISRDLARGMQGELTVQSSPGAGSTFTLSLPVGEAGPGDPGPGAGLSDVGAADRDDLVPV